MAIRPYILPAILIIFGLLSPAAPALACTDGWPPREKSVLVGHASSDDGEKLYTETLYFIPGPQGGSLRVDYRSPSDQLIARKTVQYNCNPTAPSYELVDLVEGTREGVDWNNTEVITYAGDSRKILATPDGQSIIDAGFDNAIRINWDALMAGEQVRFNYLLNQDKGFLTLRLLATNTPLALSGGVRAGTVFFKIEANNILFRVLSNPIYVGYSETSRVIRYYIGPSNLPAMAAQQRVVIKYDKPAA